MTLICQSYEYLLLQTNNIVFTSKTNKISHSAIPQPTYLNISEMLVQRVVIFEKLRIKYKVHSARLPGRSCPALIGSCSWSLKTSFSGSESLLFYLSYCVSYHNEHFLASWYILSTLKDS